MDLKMRILARGEQALSTFRRLEGRINGMLGGLSRVGAVGAGVFRKLSHAASLAIRPMKIVAGLTLGLGLTLGGLSVKSLGAAGQMETLRLRMEGVSRSLEEANRLFEETDMMAVLSPFEPEQLIEARIRLINFGMAGSRAIRAVGDAASITRRDISDIAGMVGSLETEPLRTMGIELRQEAGRFEFTFRDRMQRVRNVAVQTREAAREALIGIFETKYGGGMQKFASSWEGLVSTFRGLRTKGFAEFGMGLMPLGKRIVEDINTRLTNLIKSGKLRELGEMVAGKIEEAWVFAKSVLEYGSQIVQGLAKNAENMPEALKEMMVSGGQILAISLVNYLKAMGAIFSGLGKIMAGAFLEDVLRLPGMGLIASGMAVRRQRAMSDAEYVAFAEKNKNLSQEDFMYALAVGDREKLLKSGVEEFTRVVPSIAGETASAVKGIVAGTSERLSSLAGPGVEPFADILSRNKFIHAADVAGEKTEQVTGVRRQWVPYSPRSGPGHWSWERKTIDAPRGKFALGQTFNSGFGVFQIGNLTIKADSAQELRNKLVRMSMNPQLAAAGAY